MDDVQPELPVIMFADVLVAEEQRIRDDDDAPAPEFRAADHARIRWVGLRRSAPRCPRAVLHRAGSCAEKTRARSEVAERRAGRGHCENPLGISRHASAAVENARVLDVQPDGREQGVQVVAVFVVLVFRHHEQAAARAHPREHGGDFLRRKRGRAGGSRTLPARIARVQQREHVRTGEELFREWKVAVAEDFKITPRKKVRCARI